jgi:hypothetical protein
MGSVCNKCEWCSSVQAEEITMLLIYILPCLIMMLNNAAGTNKIITKRLYNANYYIGHNI